MKTLIPNKPLNTLLNKIDSFSREKAKYPAIVTTNGSISYGQLVESVKKFAINLQELGIQRFAILEDNTSSWVIADLAAQLIGATVIPIPLFFSQEQRLHLVKQSEAQTIISTDPYLLGSIAPFHHEFPISSIANCYFTEVLALSESATPSSKITYTSGSTGQPKGVCLSFGTINKTLLALSKAIEQPDNITHLCTLPLATLLENIAGVYLPLFKGGTVVLKKQHELGITGSSGLDLHQWCKTLIQSQPESLILTPELLKALVYLIQFNYLQLPNLRFIAVGGGKVSTELLSQAKQLNIPIYEGYGLSECGSVVALNSQSTNKLGSVGKPLSHVDVIIAEDGEILVSGNTYSGYLGEPSFEKSFVATGDLGYFDDEGFLFVSGRKKNLIISSYGRNLSPEWIEATLCANPQIAQAIVVGDGRPFNIAIVTPTSNLVSRDSVKKELQTINQSLPDYAQIQSLIFSNQPFSAADGLLTANGRVKRDAILETYQFEISTCYSNPNQYSNRQSFNNKFSTGDNI